VNRLRIAVLLVVSLISAGAAVASEQSELLYARGLVPFHNEQYQQALTLFDQAVQADEKDPYALYYRGVTQARLGNFDAAVADLRKALHLKPDLDQGALELGIALAQSGHYQDAVPWLEQAQRAAPLDADASFFLGIAQLRLGQLDAARTNFGRAATQDPKLAVPARYYQGVTEYQTRNWDAAQQHFDYVAQTSPESEMGREAKAFLAKIKAGTGPAAAPVVKPYELYGSLGFQYDDNLQLASDEAIKAHLGEQQADGRVTILAGAAYAPWRTERAQLALGYEFFQSLHFDYSQFNLQDHRGTAQLLYDVGPVQLGMLGQYDFYLLETTSFLQQATAVPWATLPEENFGRTEVFFRYRRRDFFDHTFNFGGSLPVDFSGIRDSNNYAPGIQQYVYLGSPDRYVTMRYRFEHEDPVNSAGDQFGFDGNEVGAGVGWALPMEIGAELGYSYEYQYYGSDSNWRHDNQHQLLFAAQKHLTEHLDVTLAYFGLFNDSNRSLYAYDRNIGSVSLGVRF
jgi:tetratricopeptide (TPR) repeat protein